MFYIHTHSSIAAHGKQDAKQGFSLSNSKTGQQSECNAIPIVSDGGDGRVGYLSERFVHNVVVRFCCSWPAERECECDAKSKKSLAFSRERRGTCEGGARLMLVLMGCSFLKRRE